MIDVLYTLIIVGLAVAVVALVSYVWHDKFYAPLFPKLDELSAKIDELQAEVGALEHELKVNSGKTDAAWGAIVTLNKTVSDIEPITVVQVDDKKFQPVPKTWR